MPVERPTFSESWYRVADLRPRLRSTVQIYRQHFRGQMWHVAQDPGSNQFFRLNEPAYRFVALLDGRRSVAEVWRICNEQLGDSAPTQGEAIQLLGQLYSVNLLRAELPPDAEGLFNRYRKRVRREIQSYLMNLLFVRIPLLDPDHFLERWLGVFGRLFTWYGLVVWLGLMSVGLYFVVSNAGDLARRASGILDPSNLGLLYLSLVFVSVFHEFAHSFACKKFGKATGTGGEVHVMGIMFLVFVPKPYMDASSAWTFRSKWLRVLVGTAGMMAELAIAAIAAIIWANTAEGTTIHAISYNIIFVASVSTLLFNGNPLLRYDGYYILSDMLEIANLGPRSRQYLYYLVKRYAWGYKQAQSPAHTSGERFWLGSYAVASTAYRLFICAVILMVIANKFFFVGVGLAVAAVITWVCVPLGKFVHYLLTSGELSRVRPRAVGTTVAVLAVILGSVGLIPAPDRFRVEGVVEPVKLFVVHMESDGFLRDFLPPGQLVEPDGPPLLTAENRELQVRGEIFEAEKRRLEARRRLAQTRAVAEAQILGRQIDALDEHISRIKEQIASLELQAPGRGTWVAPDIDRYKGAYLRRGDRVGLVASLDDLTIRATAGQQVATLLDQARRQVQIRIKGRPDMELGGTIERILPAGQERLPSQALGYAAGGSMATVPEDQQGTKTAERFFEVHISPRQPERDKVPLLTGQRVVVRFEAPAKPLLTQWWRSLRQLFQRRFSI